MTDLFSEAPKDLSDQAVLIVVEGEPIGKQRPKFSVQGGFVRVYTPEKTRDYELAIQMEVGQALYGRAMAESIWGLRKLPANEMFMVLQFVPRFTGPVRVDLEIRHTIRPSWNKSKKAGVADGSIAATIKPDLDNVAKIWFDAFNGCMWVDDTQVVEMSARKVFSESPGVTVTVTPLDLQSA